MSLSLLLSPKPSDAAAAWWVIAFVLEMRAVASAATEKRAGADDGDRSGMDAIVGGRGPRPGGRVREALVDPAELANALCDPQAKEGMSDRTGE